MPFPNRNGRPRKIASPAAFKAEWKHAKAENPRLTKTGFALLHDISLRHCSRLLKEPVVGEEKKDQPKSGGSGFMWGWT